MTIMIFEMLKHGLFEEIRVKVCDFLINDCDICPTFISSRCQEPCNDKETGEVGINRTMGNS